jgi:hypothetical protein
LSLTKSKLEETLQEESRQINVKPLHSSKLEKSLKNMEGIAKANGVNQMMSPIEKPIFDMKVNVTLSTGNST